MKKAYFLKIFMNAQRAKHYEQHVLHVCFVLSSVMDYNNPVMILFIFFAYINRCYLTLPLKKKHDSRYLRELTTLNEIWSIWQLKDQS